MPELPVPNEESGSLAYSAEFAHSDSSTVRASPDGGLVASAQEHRDTELHMYWTIGLTLNPSRILIFPPAW